MNHKIKLLGDWKVSKTPEVIDRLHEIQVSQVVEIRGALHGRGSLELAERARHLRISHALWLELGETQRLKVLDRFTNFKPKGKTITSTDGRLTVPLTARLARKPGQKKTC